MRQFMKVVSRHYCGMFTTLLMQLAHVAFSLLLLLIPRNDDYIDLRWSLWAWLARWWVVFGASTARGLSGLKSFEFSREIHFLFMIEIISENSIIEYDFSSSVYFGLNFTNLSRHSRGSGLKLFRLNHDFRVFRSYVSGTSLNCRIIQSQIRHIQINHNSKIEL